MLGKSEMMITHRELFAPADLKQRIFVKQPRATIASRAGSFSAGEAAAQPNGDDERTAATRRSSWAHSRTRSSRAAAG